jgi:hypothetical protein
VRNSITDGVFEEPLNGEIFDAAQGEVVGPVTTPTGTYAFEVESIVPAKESSFDDVSDQIKQQLQGQAQQEAFAAFLADYRDYWVSRTVCADGYVISRCDNFTEPIAPCPDPGSPQAQQQVQGCDPNAPVPTIAPAAPGSIQQFIPSVGGQPQKPHPAGEDSATPPTSFPGSSGGVVPGAAGGATAPPGG